MLHEFLHYTKNNYEEGWNLIIIKMYANGIFWFVDLILVRRNCGATQRQSNSIQYTPYNTKKMIKFHSILLPPPRCWLNLDTANIILLYGKSARHAIWCLHKCVICSEQWAASSSLTPPGNRWRIIESRQTQRAISLNYIFRRMMFSSVGLEMMNHNICNMIQHPEAIHARCVRSKQL